MYGLTPSHIISSFSGAVESDFAVASLSGSEVIQQEIDFQAQKLQMAFSPELNKNMEKINYEVPNISGSQYFVPGLTAFSDSMEVWIVDRCASVCSPASFRECTCGLSNEYYLSCGIKKTEDFSSLGGNVYSLDTAIDTDSKYVVISYFVDSQNSSLLSLQSILRDMVCANLGNRLFAATDGGKWSIVEHYESQAEKWIDLLKSGWMPSELKKMKLMFSGNIKSLRVGRG